MTSKVAGIEPSSLPWRAERHESQQEHYARLSVAMQLTLVDRRGRDERVSLEKSPPSDDGVTLAHVP